MTDRDPNADTEIDSRIAGRDDLQQVQDEAGIAGEPQPETDGADEDQGSL